MALIAYCCVAGLAPFGLFLSDLGYVGSRRDVLWDVVAAVCFSTGPVVDFFASTHLGRPLVSPSQH